MQNVIYHSDQAIDLRAENDQFWNYDLSLLMIYLSFLIGHN